MRRLSGVILAAALLMVPGFAQGTAFAQAPQKTTFTGDSVVLMYAINQGKEAEYEKVLASLKAALAKSTDPSAKQQAAGWKVFKSEKPLSADGPTYIHVISPVVKDADYSILNIVYSVSNDDEKRAFYDMYRGAVNKALSLIQGSAVADLSK